LELAISTFRSQYTFSNSGRCALLSWALDLRDIQISAQFQFFLSYSTYTSGKKKGTKSDQIRKILNLDYMYTHKHYPREAWSHVYTEGSATDATKNGGTGVLLQYIVEREESLALPTGVFSTNYRAEKEALTAAANQISQNTDRTHGQVVIFTYALSVLQALQPSIPQQRATMRLRLL
jgi:hypothetical protein